jgi:hypothetical protein
MSDRDVRPIAAMVVLRWVARLWSIASIGLILLFFVGEGIAPGTVSAKEWVGLVFFPIGVVVGMLVAWRKEIWGGSLTVVSLLAFYGVYGYLLNGAFPRGWAFIVFSAPGMLFLAYALVSRRIHRETATW